MMGWLIGFLLQYAFTEFLLVDDLDGDLLPEDTMGPQLNQTCNTTNILE